MSSDVQRGQVVATLDVRIDAPLQQQLDHLHLAVFGCQVQWSEALLQSATAEMVSIFVINQSHFGVLTHTKREKKSSPQSQLLSQPLSQLLSQPLSQP